MDDYFKGFNQQQSAIDAIVKGWKSPIEGFNQQQSAIDAIVKGWKSPIEGSNQQQSAIDAIVKGWKSPIEGFNQQQSAIDAIVKGWKSPIEGFNQQQSAIDAIVKGWKSPIEGSNQQQSAIDAIVKGWKSPIEGFNQQQSAIDAIVKGWKSPIEGFNQQQSALQKILSSLESTTKAQSFDFSESLIAMNNVLEDTRIDIETKKKSNPTEFEQKLLIWSHEQIEIFCELSNSLRNICNTIDTKIAGAYIWDLLNKIATIITIVNCMQANEPDIHIHNYHDDVIIESETESNKINIYIEKKEDQHKLKYKNDNERYSGGEST